MPALNFDKEFPELPDLDEPQECDHCHQVYGGNAMWYQYTETETGVLCRDCVGIEMQTFTGEEKSEAA